MDLASIRSRGAFRPLEAAPRPPAGAAQARDRFEPGPAEALSRSMPPGPGLPERGDPGRGDRIFPLLGNSGYDAKHYRIDLKVHGTGDRLEGSSTMQAVAERDLSSFNLDFRGFQISRITVDGANAAFRREGAELEVTPPETLLGGQPFEVKVEYEGRPVPFDSPSAPVPLGWIRHDGGSYVLSEPDGASSWFPVNDHPGDKASYTFRLDVEKPLAAIANGHLEGVEDHGDRATWVWEARDPMASYLATVGVGDYVGFEQTGPAGLPIRHYVPRDLVDEARTDFARTPEMVEFLSGLFGPYPFEEFGSLVVDHHTGGAALETQTRPVYGREMITGDRSMETVYVHELAHQWFGDSVALEQWQDIWLNEGFATYAQWLWDTKDRGTDALDVQVRRMHRYLERSGPDREPLGRPGPEGLFSPTVYVRGALTLHALRTAVGDEAFFRGVRAYAERFRDGNATTADFRTVMEEAAGRPLGDLFDRWVYSRPLPPLPA